MENKAFWQGSEYFRSFDEFEPSAVYVPTFLLECFVKVDFSSISDINVVELFNVLSILLKFSFKPTSRNIPPKGYVDFTIKEISDLAKMDKKKVSISIQRLIECQVVGKKDEYLWIRHPNKWLLSLSEDQSNSSDAAQIMTLLGLS